jgi:hypothetical protein
MSKTKKVPRGGAGFRGWNCPGGGRPAQGFFSLFERKALVVLRECPFASWVVSQPMVMEFPVEGSDKPRRYTPDFRLLAPPFGQFLGETKPKHRLESADVQELLRLARERCESEGEERFLVLTEREVERQPRLENSMLLKRFRSYPQSVELREQVLTEVERSPGVTVHHLRQKFGPQARESAQALVANRLIHCDMNRSLQNASPLWPASHQPMGESYADIFGQ